MMEHPNVLTIFPFDKAEPPVSLYAYAPVYRVRDSRGDWVVKRTGIAHSDGCAIGRWLCNLHGRGVHVVVPVADFSPNPRTLDDGSSWVVYPYISGTPYIASIEQITEAGALLGQIHTFGSGNAVGLKTYPHPIVRSSEWVAQHVTLAIEAMREHNIPYEGFQAKVSACVASVPLIEHLPLVGCSFDFKASNLVFGAAPVLIDPDHAAYMSRLSDLAVAALLFHNDLPSAPGRLWTPKEWRAFLAGYQRFVTFTEQELLRWPDVLQLAWLDQGVWLLANFPEGWANPKEAQYLADLATVDFARFVINGD